MRRSGLALLFCACLAALTARPLQAQGTPFAIRVEQPNAVSGVSNGATIAVNSPVGRSETLSVSLTYIGQGSSTIRTSPSLVGSTAFSVQSADSAPASLASGQTYRFTLRFAPQNSTAVSAQVSFPFSESVTGGNGATITTQGFFALQFVGTAPELVVSYISSDAQSYTPVTSGSAIPFPATALGAASASLISVANRGSGSGDLSSAIVTGEDFQITGLGLLPAAIPAGSELRFGIRFQPKLEGARTGRLLLGILGANAEFALTGDAFQTRFAYELIQPTGISEITPGGTINLGEVLPGEIVTAQVLVKNINPVTVALPAIAAFGAGFAVSENPGVRNLRAGETVSFGLNAQSTQIGAQRGRLRVGDDAFDLLVTGSGAQLRFSYTTGASGSVALSSGASIFFPPTRIGATESAVVTIRNNGISEASLINISTGDASGPFAVQDLPTLPTRLQPGESVSFGIRFRPSAPGVSSATLRVDSTQFVLSGTASALPPLPSYRFSVPSGNIGALEQPLVGLQLSQPYPVALTGVLTLTQEAVGFVSDPSVRFSNGAQSVNFTIAANSTQAIFANGASSVRFQTGSVAGTLSLRASFSVATTALTDDNPEVLRLTVNPAAPRVLSAQAVPASANVLQLVVTGLSLSRSLTKMDIELRPVAGANLSATRFSLNLEGESFVWFRSAASQAAGGIFAIQIPLNFSISGNTTTAGVSALIETIASIQVNLSNETGTSSPFVIELR